MMRQQPKITTVFKETKTKIPNSIYSKVLGTAALQLQRGSAASLSHGSCTDTPSPAALLAVQNDFLCPRSRAGSLQGAEHCSPLSCSMSVGAQSSAAAGTQSLLLPHALFCTAAALLWLRFQIPTTSVSQSSLQADLSLQPLGKAPSIRLFLRDSKPSCAKPVQWESGPPAQKQNSTCKASQHAAHCQLSKGALHLAMLSYAAA